MLTPTPLRDHTIAGTARQAHPKAAPRHRQLLADSSRPDAQTCYRKAVLQGLASAGAFGAGQPPADGRKRFSAALAGRTMPVERLEPTSRRGPLSHTTPRFGLDNATAPSLGDLQEPYMSKQHKRADPLAQKHAPSDAGRAEKDAARLGRDTRGWVAANKRSGKEFEARRNLPSGPLGGSGRKTNISRSS